MNKSVNITLQGLCVIFAVGSVVLLVISAMAGDILSVVTFAILIVTCLLNIAILRMIAQD